MMNLIGFIFYTIVWSLVYGLLCGQTRLADFNQQ